MFFFLPYRVKNPPKRFPYVTVALMIINTLIFLCTSEYGLVIRDGIAEEWGLSQANMSIVTLFTYMFLHAHIFHLAGNMLFLWIFGAAVEGRLGPIFYSILYVILGFAGGLSHQWLSGVVDPTIPLVGASGAIFGLAGAYLYLSPFAHIMVAYAYWIFLRGAAGVVPIAAQWVILYYALKNLADGLLFRGTGGGVANFAHLGGLVVGFVILMMARMKRESEEYSEAQASRADSFGYLMSIPLHELEALMEGPDPTPDVLIAFTRKALTSHAGIGHRRAAEMIMQHQALALDQTDPDELVDIALGISVEYRLPAPFLLRLAGKLETVGSYGQAIRTYRYIGLGEGMQTTPENETALLRMARLVEQTDPDKTQAAAIYTEMLRLFPEGPQSSFARTALSRLPKPTAEYTFSRGTAQPTAPAPGGLASVSSPLAGVGQAVSDQNTEEPQMPTIFLAPVGSHSTPPGQDGS